MRKIKVRFVKSAKNLFHWEAKEKQPASNNMNDPVVNRQITGSGFRLKVTVSGDKNARLICITDDNSVIEPPEDEELVDNKILQTENTEPPKVILKPSSKAQTKAKDSNNKASKRTQKGKQSANIKISRLKKSERNLRPLDKKLALDAIQYKLDFYRYCKNNPMYKRTTTCQPWIIMSKISEELLNQCLLTVAREIEINDIVEKVYQSELQL